MPSLRWILHLDMDAFFASVEQLDNPEFRGKPLIIGGAERGVVSTASYEARRYGVRSAMPMFQAKKLCPRGIFIRGRMGRYVEKSKEVMAVLADFSPLVEQASIDEAYLDASGLDHVFDHPAAMALQVQKAVYERCGLTCSIGLAPVKFLAKIASDMQKPNGLTILTHDSVTDFLAVLPVERIPGVGPATLKTLSLLGIRFAGDMARYPQDFWQKHMGKIGLVLYERAFGRDDRAVEPYSAPKSESAENTFAKDTTDHEVLTAWLFGQSERVGYNLRKQNLAGKTITLKLKYGDFTQKTRSRTLQHHTNSTREIYETAMSLLREQPLERPLRLIGVGVSQFGRDARQLSLLPDAKEEERRRDAALDATLDAVRERWGKNIVLRGKVFPKLI